MSASVQFDQRDFRNALGRFATGVAIVTTCAPDGRPVGLTANSFTAVSLSPPLVLWCLDESAATVTLFSQSDAFAINILRSNQRGLSHQFATPSEDKFAGLDWTAGYGGSPLLPGSLAVFECQQHRYYEAGDHRIFIGLVKSFTYSAGQPLVFSNGQYAVTAEHPDNFGIAADSRDFMDLMW